MYSLYLSMRILECAAADAFASYCYFLRILKRMSLPSHTFISFHKLFFSLFCCFSLNFCLLCSFSITLKVFTVISHCLSFTYINIHMYALEIRNNKFVPSCSSSTLRQIFNFIWRKKIDCEMYGDDEEEWA